MPSGHRFTFNGKEADNEVYGSGNAIDFGARIYDSRLGRWLSVDPFMRKYPSQSTFNYVANNPILYIDLDGREVFIYGSDAEKAFNALKLSTSLTISYDVETGQLSASGIPKTPADEMLLIAINNPNIRVEIFTTRGTVRGNQIILGGSYEGSKKEIITDEHGQSKEIVITKQIINLKQLELMGESGLDGSGTTGDNVKHEILESYIGGQIDPGGDYSSGYERAHKEAMKLDPSLVDLIAVTSNTEIVYKHTYLTNKKQGENIDWTKDVIDMGRPESGFQIPRNPSRSVPSGSKKVGSGGKTSDFNNN